jgi:F-type H+-transporting ATPase subunit b
MEALGINAGHLISQIANLAILLVLLRIVLYRPVLNMLDQRAAKIRQGLEDAEAASQQAAQAQAEYDQRIQQAQEEAQAILSQAREEAGSLREQALADAQREAQELLERTRQSLQMERSKALHAERAHLADLVIAAASKVIGQSLDQQAHRRLVEQFLAESTASE